MTPPARGRGTSQRSPTVLVRIREKQLSRSLLLLLRRLPPQLHLQHPTENPLHLLMYILPIHNR